LKYLKAVLLLTVLVIVGLFAFRSYNARRFHLEQDTRFLMDTYVTIYAVGPSSATRPAIRKAFERMQAVDEKFNIHNPDSPLYDFNRKGTPITDPEILAVTRLALSVSRETDGAFDITISPLVDLWGFYGDDPALPDEAAIEAYLEQVDYRRLALIDGELRKRSPAVRIDLGGIAKGYAIGEAARSLKENGAVSALIDAGGDVYALGAKGEAPWKVGIRNPRGDEILGYVEVIDLAVMGSGDYERFFVHDGRRYHHILDPKTGYPAKGMVAVNLFAADPMTADVWCTAVFAMGPEKGLELVDQKEGMEAIVITEAGEKRLSSGLEHLLKDLPETQ
jgi:thiamine biosynthesis lipoprotein